MKCILFINSRAQSFTKVQDPYCFNMKIFHFCFIMFFVSHALLAQEVEKDSVRQLDEVVVQSFYYDRPLQDVPLAYGYVTPKEFERFGNTSFVPVMNTIPGVRMEERSPGSYRFSIRGSTLRAPFGVRNVKVYWNGLPLTDPGGNTYLNMLDFNSVSEAEIIKGPGGSLYGAGTGGVLILKSPKAQYNESGVEVSSVVGSYGLVRYSVKAQTGSKKSNTTIQYNHQQSDGYRDQSKMGRDVLQIFGNYILDPRRTISTNIFYGDLFYQTPGGLNKAQYDQDASQARPAAGPNPGAVEQRATLFNKTFYAGLSQDYDWNEKWSNQTGVYGSFTQFENSSIRNYERKTEQSLGGRTNTQYKFSKGKLNFGAEYQHGFSPVNVYNNNKGQTGALQSNDEIISTSSTLFAQVEFNLPYNFFLTTGASYNFYSINYTRLSDVPAFSQEKKFDPSILPRVALLKKLNSVFSIYGSISKGFSPPTVAELYPSTATFNNDLEAEHGINYELGVRGALLQKQLNVDLTVYSFQLEDAIVIRRTNDGADYFTNAGGTSQKGLEFHASWQPTLAVTNFISDFKVWSSYTLNDYHFKKYQQGVNDYSNHPVTGVAPNILLVGIDITLKPTVYVNITYTYTDKLPLDDATTVYADAYSLLNARAGYRFASQHFTLDAFGGVDNVLDEKYSLGNDLNAFGGRYYNAAAPRNFYVGVKMGLKSRKL